MSAYSLGGYKIAALARSKKTLMVEGRTDSLVMKRLFLEIAASDDNFTAPLVDTPDIVKDPLLSGLGNRDRVRNVIGSLASPGGKVAGLIDREWEGFCLTSFAANDCVVALAPLFVTKGHSIENYFFDRGICRNFLARRYSELIGAGLFVLMETHFDRILDFAFAYSVALARRNLISKAESLLTPFEINLGNEYFCILPGLLEKLRDRGASETDLHGIVNEVGSIQLEIRGLSDQTQLNRWKCHGHLGDEAIWACIGLLAIREGVTIQDAQGIATGYREERLRSAADAIATNPGYRHSSVGTILDWARG